MVLRREETMAGGNGVTSYDEVAVLVLAVLGISGAATLWGDMGMSNGELVRRASTSYSRFDVIGAGTGDWVMLLRVPGSGKRMNASERLREVSAPAVLDCGEAGLLRCSPSGDRGCCCSVRRFVSMTVGFRKTECGELSKQNQ